MMNEVLSTLTGGAAMPPSLFPLKLIQGCNTPDDVITGQIYANVRRDYLPWLMPQDVKDRPLVIVAGGPSLKERWEEIAAHNGDILALNGAYEFLMDRGIAPDYWMLLDAREANIDFLNKIHPRTRHYLAAQCHPAIFDRLHDSEATLYLTSHAATDEAIEGLGRERSPRLHGPAGTVGMKALGLAYVLGYRELHLYGYDSSHAGEAHHAFAQPLNDDRKTLDIYIGEQLYVTSPSLANQVQEFPGLAAMLVRDCGVSIELHCAGLMPDWVAYCNEMGRTPLETREQEKYEAMWSESKYRKEAPGEQIAPAAILALGMEAGDSVIDFGCGTGRGAARLQNAGMHVTAVDFARNCLDEGVSVPFVYACLWDLPEGLAADWGYCTDVMEHIPPEKSARVVAGIAKRCRRGAYFQIATGDDNLGVLIGRKLHMTVMPAESWLLLMQRFWDEVSWQELEGGAVFVCRAPKEGIIA